jgi:phospholipid N-methyltransferase
MKKNTNSPSYLSTLKEYFYFVSKSIFRLNQVGHFLPSSKALINSIVKVSNLNSANHIVELGSGTGGTSTGILSKMNPNAQLCIIEIDQIFTEYMAKNIDDDRLIICNDGAQNLIPILDELCWKHVDVVISGIPFSTLPNETAEQIIENIYASLKPGGLFVAYQLRDQVSQLATPLFGSPQIQWQYKNLPPMRIFTWKKAA